ncbi:MAG: endonuclease/exonuclease/phosphatase family protein, partial [Candidatus Saccharibacteria bacterium]|nr:endonuclease/exonuclease/phosphatase family protein [Pseudorhodobacter sp.]
VVLLSGIDYDYGQEPVAAMAEASGEAGVDYPHLLALRPNTGVQTGLDLDGNGVLGEARDAQGYGRFSGSGGMAILSRRPFGAVRDFSGLLWRDLAEADLPPDMTEAARAVQMLSTAGHYDVAVDYAAGKALHLLVWYATPPVFDGAEDRNGRRNHDEAAFWLKLLAGALPWPAPDAPFVVIGQSNLDPVDGDGRHDAMAALMALPALQDAGPRGESGHVDPRHRGDPAMDTAFYGKGVGGLRVDVILPAAGIQVTAAGVLSLPQQDPYAATLAAASRHWPVWAVLNLP